MSEANSEPFSTARLFDGIHAGDREIKFKDITIQTHCSTTSTPFKTDHRPPQQKLIAVPPPRDQRAHLIFTALGIELIGQPDLPPKLENESLVEPRGATITKRYSMSERQKQHSKGDSSHANWYKSGAIKRSWPPLRPWRLVRRAMKQTRCGVTDRPEG